jgi:hypothetical protein
MLFNLNLRKRRPTAVPTSQHPCIIKTSKSFRLNMRRIKLISLTLFKYDKYAAQCRATPASTIRPIRQPGRCSSIATNICGVSTRKPFDPRRNSTSSHTFHKPAYIIAIKICSYFVVAKHMTLFQGPSDVQNTFKKYFENTKYALKKHFENTK